MVVTDELSIVGQDFAVYGTGSRTLSLGFKESCHARLLTVSANLKKRLHIS